MGIYLNSPKTEKFSEDGGNCRLRYGLSSMQGWRATMEDAHASITDLDATTSFFGVYDGHGDLFKVCDVLMMIVRKESMQPNSTCSELRLSGVRLSVMECVSSKVVAKFCSKFLHQQVLKNEAYAAGDIGKSVQKALFRLLDFITKEFFLSPSRRVFEVTTKSRNHENEKLLKGLDVMKTSSLINKAPSLNTRLLPQGSAGVLDGKTTLLQGGGTPSQPGFDTRDELIGQTPQTVAPAVPAIPSPQKPLPLTTRSDDLRRKTVSLLEEYFSVQILDEALQCVEELKDPAFHPEVAKEAISFALEKSPPCVGPVIKLLEFLLTKKVLTARDIGTGLHFEVLKELLEMVEDNRFRKAIFELVATQFSKDGEILRGWRNGRLRYGLSSMQGWRATMEDADNTNDKFGQAGICKVVAKFCSKFLHQQVLKNEAYAAGDIGTSVQKAFFRMDEMMRGQKRGWRELAALGDKINKFTGIIEGLIWSPRCGGSNEQPDDWAFEEVKNFMTVGIEVPQNALENHNISSNLSTSQPLDNPPQPPIKKEAHLCCIGKLGSLLE
ncbi:hypothetical protein DKX38_026829 [Salix brachista]|uniref:MI domain-containing protein n=1 Tax=Salix brachista TaxID=2182728 RepID=A0A5N5JAN2_9ROSI|nr:hypothetical protein DKX38_026829 [Salix brachista]